MYCSIFRANNIKNEIWSYISRNLICAIVPAFLKIFIYSSNVSCKNTQWFSLLLWFIVAQKPNPPITHRHTRVQEHASSYKLRAAVNGFSGTHWYLLPWWKITWASFVSAWLCVVSLSLSLPFISLLLYLSTFFFSTMGTFLWQLVTTEQFLLVYLRAWFTDVTHSERQSAATTATWKTPARSNAPFIHCRRCRYEASASS